MNWTMDYIASFFPSDACIPCVLARDNGPYRQVAKRGIVTALLQSGVSHEEIRQGLGIADDAPECEDLVGADWCRCVTVSQLMEELERRHPELAG